MFNPMIRLLPIVLITACAAEELRTIDELAVQVWQPEDGGDVPMAAVKGCKETDASDALEPLWCVPISPEPASEAFDGGTCAATSGTASDMRCRFDNMIGASGLTGTAARPVFTYCDSDAEGGVRVASYDAESTGGVNEVVEQGQCRGFPQDGGLGTPGPDDGQFSAFIRYDEDGKNRVYLTEQGSDGAMRGAPTRVPGSEDPNRATVSGGSLYVQFADGTLQVRDLKQLEIPHFIAVDSSRFGAGFVGDREVVAVCSEDFGIRVVALEDREVAETRVLGDGCLWSDNPVVAGSDDDAVVIGWHDGGGLQLAFLGADLVERRRHPIDGLLVEVAWDGSFFWSLDSTGALRRWTAEGDLAGEYTHPYIPHPDGYSKGLRILIEDETLVVAAITEFRIVAGGHQSLINSLDLSAVPLP